MSPSRPEADDEPDTDPASDAPDRTDGTTELDQRAAFALMFNDPAVRNYTIAGLSALAMMFLILFQAESDIGGLLIVLIGVAGIMFRFSGAPVVVLLLLTYFMVLPSGIPGEQDFNSLEIEEGLFRPPDVMMALAVLVYVACHYRLIGLTAQAVAFEGGARRQGEPVTRRPAALIAPIELGTLIGVSVTMVIAGQVFWWLVNNVEVAAGEDIPFVWAGEGWSRYSDNREVATGGLTPGITRAVVLLGLMFFSVLLGRLVFAYWRLRMMGAAEGGMILLDGGWDETRRERSRQEKWRIWGRKRAEAQDKAEAEAAAKAKAKARNKR